MVLVVVFITGLLAGLGVSFDKPKPFVYAARDFREDVGRIGVVQCIRFVNSSPVLRDRTWTESVPLLSHAKRRRRWPADASVLVHIFGLEIGEIGLRRAQMPSQLIKRFAFRISLPFYNPAVLFPCDSPFFLCVCQRCGNGPKTSRFWFAILLNFTPGGRADQLLRFRLKRWRFWCATSGPGMFVNCRTSWSGR